MYSPYYSAIFAAGFIFRSRSELLFILFELNFELLVGFSESEALEKMMFFLGMMATLLLSNNGVDDLCNIFDLILYKYHF